MKDKRLLVLAAVVLLAPSLSWGAGFALFEHGNRGMAMGGAFTAVADDPSAMFWNIGGLAFQTDDKFVTMAGFTLIMPSQDFTGQSPYPGDGYKDSQINQTFFPSHLYTSWALNDRVVLGFAFLSPFGLGTQWEDDSAGRFISKRTDIKTFELSPQAAFKLNDYIGLGFGVDYRIAQIDLTKNIPFLNPHTQQVADVGQVHMHTDGISEAGWGWHAGVMFKTDIGLSLGINYRSGMTIDMEGVASFQQFPTGYADFDALLTSTLPFGQKTPLTTAIDFPNFFSIGLAYTAEKYLVSVQWNQMGWDTFQELDITFTDPNYAFLSSSAPMHYENSNQYRFGFEYSFSESAAMQLGFLIDETPQPVATMSPILGGGDRTGYCIGFSYNGKKIWADFGYMFLDIESRTTNPGNHYDYFGTYENGTAHLIGTSLGIKF